ncbi:MAG: hypothetical protein SPJ34_03540 [Candidatus Ornithospirochaeta sp.]|nr:hypothetical protein [Candidatus Ornithospirochaeta sp.]
MRKDGTMTIKEGIVQGFRSLRLLSICKLLVAAISIMHLILANVHVAGLLKLENEICGFVMFASVIFGLVCFFQSSRSKMNNLRELLPLAFFLAVTIACLLILASIYSSAIRGQASLKDPSDVVNALNMTYIIAALYGVTLIGFTADYFISGRKHNGEKREDA